MISAKKDKTARLAIAERISKIWDLL